MSQEPTYPADAVPGRINKPATSPDAAPDPIASCCRTGARLKRSRQPGGARPVTPLAGGAGVAIGVGSAAVAAALLYANRPRRD